jgi:hypothetical protein
MRKPKADPAEIPAPKPGSGDDVKSPARLTGLRVIDVFTHDGIAVGEDGPTRQSAEQRHPALLLWCKNGNP